MQKAKRIFVFISGLLGFVLRVLFRESSRIPAFHRDLGMVGRGQSFLRANGGYPLIDRLFVYLLQFIELRVVHRCGMLRQPIQPVNRCAHPFTQN